MGSTVGTGGSGASSGGPEWMGRPSVRTLGARLFACLICLGIVLGIFGTLLSIRAHRGEVLGTPAQTGMSLTPGYSGWTAPKTVGGASLAGVPPASLMVEFGSLDVATETIPARVSLAFTERLVSHLRWKIPAHQALVPLAAVPYHVWARLPVGIWLTLCVDSNAGVGPCGTPTATISLGQLVTDGGRAAAVLGASVQAPVTLPVSGSATSFPSDEYGLGSDPRLTLPNGVVLASAAAGSSVNTRSAVPAKVTLFADAVFGDRWVTAFQSGQEIELWIRRPTAYQLTIYLMALLPLLLGVIVIHVSVRQAPLRRPKRPVLDLGVIAGLIAAMLAILPLRAVLVPTDLDVTGLTLLDYILVLDVLVIAAFVFFQYAWLVWTPRMPGRVWTPRMPGRQTRRDRQPGPQDRAEVRSLTRARAGSQVRRVTGERIALPGEQQLGQPRHRLVAVPLRFCQVASAVQVGEGDLHGSRGRPWLGSTARSTRENLVNPTTVRHGHRRGVSQERRVYCDRRVMRACPLRLSNPSRSTTRCCSAASSRSDRSTWTCNIFASARDRNRAVPSARTA